MNIVENKPALAVIGGVVVAAVLGSVVVALKDAEYSRLTSAQGEPAPQTLPPFEIVDVTRTSRGRRDEQGVIRIPILGKVRIFRATILQVCFRWTSHVPGTVAAANARLPRLIRLLEEGAEDTGYFMTRVPDLPATVTLKADGSGKALGSFHIRRHESPPSSRHGR